MHTFGFSPRSQVNSTFTPHLANVSHTVTTDQITDLSSSVIYSSNIYIDDPHNHNSAIILINDPMQRIYSSPIEIPTAHLCDGAQSMVDSSQSLCTNSDLQAASPNDNNIKRKRVQVDVMENDYINANETDIPSHDVDDGNVPSDNNDEEEEEDVISNTSSDFNADQTRPLILLESPGDFFEYYHIKYGRWLSLNDPDRIFATATESIANVTLVFSHFKMNIPSDGNTHVLVMIDAGNLQVRLKAFPIENRVAEIASGLAEFMLLNGIFREFHCRECENRFDIISTAFNLLQLSPTYSINIKPPNNRLVDLTGDMAIQIMESYMYSADADHYDWIDTIYWAMYAIRCGTKFNHGPSDPSLNMFDIARADIKQAFTLLTFDLFEIRDHRIFPNYPQQLFVKLYIDFNLTELGIGDWHPLTPRIESSLAFQNYTQSSREVRQWLAQREIDRNSM